MMSITGMLAIAMDDCQEMSMAKPFDGGRGAWSDGGGGHGVMGRGAWSDGGGA